MKALCRSVVAVAVAAGMVGDPVPAAAQDGPAYGYEYFPTFWHGWYAGVHLGHGEVGPLDGFLGGAQIGKNWQNGQIVYGWEADVTASDISFEESFFGVREESSIDWMATVRGRLGYAFHPSFLGYATAGLGIVSGSSSVSFDPPFNDFDEFDDELTFDDTETDFVFGLGLEGKLGYNSTLRVEYLGFTDTEIDVIRAGLNFKLGGY